MSGRGREREVPSRTPLKGTGGMDIVKFLNDARNQMSEMMLT